VIPDGHPDSASDASATTGADVNRLKETGDAARAQGDLLSAFIFYRRASELRPTDTLRAKLRETAAMRNRRALAGRAAARGRDRVIKFAAPLLTVVAIGVIAMLLVTSRGNPTALKVASAASKGVTTPAQRAPEVYATAEDGASQVVEIEPAAPHAAPASQRAKRARDRRIARKSRPSTEHTGCSGNDASSGCDTAKIHPAEQPKGLLQLIFG
jgi:hypothetical protein